MAYRRLLVAIIWKHYQMQMDDLLERTRSLKLRFADALKEIEDLFRKASTTVVHDAHATLPVFRINQENIGTISPPPTGPISASLTSADSLARGTASPTFPFARWFGGVPNKRAFSRSCRGGRTLSFLPYCTIALRGRCGSEGCGITHCCSATNLESFSA